MGGAPLCRAWPAHGGAPFIAHRCACSVAASCAEPAPGLQNMRVLENGEAVSVDGTHLGHNLPDGDGDRFCIDLVCIAGREGGSG